MEPTRTFESIAPSGASTTANYFETTNRSHFTPTTQKDVLEASRRQDILLKYGKYGTRQPMGREASSEDGFATISQLSFNSEANPLKVGSFGQVNKEVKQHTLVVARQKALAQEALRSRYVTRQQEALEQTNLKPEERAAAKPKACRPKADGGQEAQVGRKAQGMFAREMDQDYLRIGLRK